MKRYQWILSVLCLWGMSSGAAAEGAEAVTNPAQKEAAPAGEPLSGTTFVLENGEVFAVTEETRFPLPLPAPAVAIYQHRNMLFVALGRQGALVFDTTSLDTKLINNLRSVRVMPAVAEEVIGFALIDGEVWIRMVSTKIVPFAAGAVETTVSKLATVRTAAESEAQSSSKKVSQEILNRPVSILKVEDGKATLDIGSAEGVQIGDRFSVFKTVTMRGARGETIGGEESFVGDELAAVVEVVAVNKNHCLVSLWRGDRVTVKDTIRPQTREHRRSYVFPRHLTDLGELSITLRPILNVEGPIGFGALNNLSVTYWGKHYFVGVVLDPLGFAFTDEGNFGLMNAAVEAGFNSRAFAIGLGAGVQVNRFENPAFAITQSVRFGAKDGLNFEARNAFHLRLQTDLIYENSYYYGGSAQPTEEEVLGFEWGGLTSQLNIPLGSRLTLFFGGGGGDDFFFGEGGVHAWLLGNGDIGSIGLSASAGAAGLFASNYNDNYYYGEDDGDISIEAIGPMIALGVDWRFGFHQGLAKK